MSTEYSQALNFFRSLVNVKRASNTDLRDILLNFARLKQQPNDIAAAKYLIKEYHNYNNMLKTVAAYV